MNHEPCAACVEHWTDRLLSNSTIGQKTTLLHEAAYFIAVAKCRHVDPAAVLREPVPLERVFAYGHAFGEQNWSNIVDLETAIGARRYLLAKCIMPALDGGPIGLFSGRSQQHKELCRQGAVWFELRGIAWTANEDALRYPFFAFADVMAKDRSTAIECGYTNAGKILAALDCGMRVLVVPYREETSLPVEVGFLFSPGIRGAADVVRCKSDPFKAAEAIAAAIQR